MTTTSGRVEDLKQKVFALLVPYKHGCTVRQLTQDYYEIQGESLPYQDYGYGSVITLLRDMHDMVRIDFNNGKHIIKCIPSSKSAHISALVAGQKTDSKKMKAVRKQFRPSPYYPTVPVPPVQIQVEILTKVIDLVSKHPNGISKMDILQMIQSYMPYTQISMHNMEAQLQQLSHAIQVADNYIYPKKVEPKPLMDCFLPNEGKPIPDNKMVYVGGCEDLEDACDFDDSYDFDFLPAGCPQSSVSKKTSTNRRKPISSFIQDSLSHCPDKTADENLNNTRQKPREEQGAPVNPEERLIDAENKDEEDSYYLNKENVEMLINDRLKIRLENLIQKYPGGIRCAELPDKYLDEYKVPLSYVELGFSSVREFASLLPNIFQCVPSTDTADYKLYPTNTQIPSCPKQRVSNLVDLHSMVPTIWEEENDVLPASASLSICKELIPDDVLTIGECVGVISVENLINIEKPYLEVVVVEVFTPTFFWIHLRKHKKAFKSFMDDLHQFYQRESNNHIIPSVVLEKGLNCACTYNGLWHRGIIKAVNPDLQVTVFFYDYGTLKTYPASNLRYLHRSFSHLPAQAIACGLVNTKPFAGARWTRSVTNKFASKTCQIPLIATIASINEEDNTMMVTLTDTSEEEDVHINDWMVERKLALHGKMVCMKRRNFLFSYYLRCRENIAKLTALCAEQNKNVESNQTAKHKHLVAPDIPLHQKTPSGISPKNSTISSTSSNSNSHNQPRTRREMLLSLLERNQKRKKTSSSELQQSPSDMKLSESITHETREEISRGREQTRHEGSLFRAKLIPLPSDDDDIPWIGCPGTCGGKCRKGHYIEPVDWTELLEAAKGNTRTMLDATPDKPGKNEVNPTTSKEQNRNIIAPDNCFLQAISASPHAVATGGNIYWSSSGNLVNNDCDTSAVLKRIKNIINNFEGNRIAVSPNVLERLSMKANLPIITSSESAASETTDKHTDGSADILSNTEENAVSAELDTRNEISTTTDNAESQDLSRCSGTAEERAQSPRLNHAENPLTNKNLEDSYENGSSQCDSSSNSSPMDGIGSFPPILSHTSLILDPTSPGCQQGETDTTMKETQGLGQALAEDISNTTDKHKNYYMHLRTNTARSRMMQMLMRMQNSSNHSDDLDSDDNTISDQNEVSNELGVVKQLVERSSYKIPRDVAEKSLVDSGVFGDDYDDGQNEKSLAQRLKVSDNSMIDKEEQTQVEEVLNEFERIQNVPESIDIPVFNDDDLGSDSDEYDVQLKIEDFIKNENHRKNLLCMEA